MSHCRSLCLVSPHFLMAIWFDEYPMSSTLRRSKYGLLLMWKIAFEVMPNWALFLPQFPGPWSYFEVKIGQIRESAVKGGLSRVVESLHATQKSAWRNLLPYSFKGQDPKGLGPLAGSLECSFGRPPRSNPAREQLTCTGWDMLAFAICEKAVVTSTLAATYWKVNNKY